MVLSKHSSRGSNWNRVRKQVLANYGNECIGLYPAVCQPDGGGYPLEVDHIVPKSKGGTDDLENLQVLCKFCNGMRQDKDMPIEKSWFNPDWYPEGGLRRGGR